MAEAKRLSRRVFGLLPSASHVLICVFCQRSEVLGRHAFFLAYEPAAKEPVVKYLATQSHRISVDLLRGMPLSPLPCTCLGAFFQPTHTYCCLLSEKPPTCKPFEYLQKEGDAVYAGFVRQVDLDESGCQRCQVRLQVSSPAEARGRHATALRGEQSSQKEIQGTSALGRSRPTQPASGFLPSRRGSVV